LNVGLENILSGVFSLDFLLCVWVAYFLKNVKIIFLVLVAPFWILIYCKTTNVSKRSPAFLKRVDFMFGGYQEESFHW